MSACFKTIEFKHCTINFDYTKGPYEKIVVTFGRYGKPSITVGKEDFADICNSLLICQQLTNSSETVECTNISINPNFHKGSENEIVVLGQKINTIIDISIMGFQHDEDLCEVRKVYTIKIDKDDDVFDLTSEFLRFATYHGYKGKIAIEN
jgi:hypothetical protein